MLQRGEAKKHRKVCLNWVSNSQPPGHESDTLTTEPPGRGLSLRMAIATTFAVINSLGQDQPEMKVSLRKQHRHRLRQGFYNTSTFL